MAPDAINERVLALRAEIAEIQHLNEAYRRRSGHNGIEIGAHGNRRIRLVQIMEELSSLSRQLGTGLPDRQSDRSIRDRTAESENHPS